MAGADLFTTSELIAWMSPAVGREKAGEIVAQELLAQHVFVEPFPRTTARSILEAIAKMPGIIGIAGRVAMTRLEAGGTVDGVRSPLRRPTRPLTLLVDLLAPTIGQEHARRVVEETARLLGLHETIDFDEALALLERIAVQPGVVGIAARFAKTRIHLSW